VAQSFNAITAVIVIIAVAAASLPAGAQWLKYPSPGAPRTPGGEVDMSAPTPRLANGKPDLSGVWMTADPACGGVGGPASAGQLIQLVPPSRKCPVRGPTMSRQGINMGVDLPGGLPYQPWLAALVEKRISTQAKDDPHIRCLPDLFLRAYGLPHYLKFVHTPNLLVMLNEFNGVYRQVFTDGRPLPEDPNPSWQGYSSATWSGDTLVIDTIGFRDDLWIDWAGSVITEAAKVRERIRRPDFGHLEIEVTVDDPKAYTKPWTVTLRQQFAADAELIDEVCAENEKFGQHLK
jgi:hypothetical protein